jgi:RND family efflux transporter MFP subunit
MQVAAYRAAGVSASVAALAQGVLRAMLMNKLKTIAVFAAASMTLIVASFVIVAALSPPAQSGQEPERSSIPRPPVTETQPPDPAEVPVSVVKKSTFRRTTSQPGTVEPYQRVDVLPRASGTVVRIAVDIGSAVKRGDALAEIESPELELELARARASIQQAKVRIQTARFRAQVADSAVKTALATLASSEAALKAAETQRDYRKKQLQRIRQLVERAAAAQRLLDEEEDRFRAAEAEAFSAKVQVTVAKAGVEEARAKLESSKADMKEFEVGLRLAEVDQQKAELMQAGARVVSPIDGIVTRRSCNVGEFVRAAASGGTNPLFTIMQTRSVRIVTPVPDRDVPFIDVGDPATFQADAFRGREYKGKVSRMADAEDTNDRTMRVEIDLDNADGRLRPGMYGRVDIQLDAPVDAISIPSSALMQSSDGSSSCYRVVNGRVVLTPVTIADNDGQNARVVDGLGDGAVVVTRAADVRDGQPVKPALSGSGRPSTSPR